MASDLFLTAQGYWSKTELDGSEHPATAVDTSPFEPLTFMIKFIAMIFEVSTGR